MPEFHLSLGSNVGDRESHLDAAIARLVGSGLDLSRVSSVYETEPVGEAAGPNWFLNLAVSGRTDLPASDLLAICRRVETDMWRERGIAGGPRTIDIDLLLYGEWTVSAEECEVPHPRLHERRFVLEPLAEIAGWSRHPGFDRTIGELLAGLEDTARVIRRGDFGGPLAGVRTRPGSVEAFARETAEAIDRDPPRTASARSSIGEDPLEMRGAPGEPAEAPVEGGDPEAGRVPVREVESSPEPRRGRGTP